MHRHFTEGVYPIQLAGVKNTIVKRVKVDFLKEVDPSTGGFEKNKTEVVTYQRRELYEIWCPIQL